MRKTAKKIKKYKKNLNKNIFHKIHVKYNKKITFNFLKK